MANPTSRQGLIDYCLRKLGDPVIEINVDIDQIEDRVDESLQYWQEFHSDATYRSYVSHLVTADDITNKYIPVQSDVLFITKLFNVNSTASSKGNMFDIKYQMMLNDISDLRNMAGDLAYYDQMKQYLEMLDMTLNGYPQTTHSRKQDRLYIHGNIEDGDILEGKYIVYEAYKIVEPGQFGKIFNDIWLKDYTTALIKQQWGSNLIKFEGMQLPGGVMLNGRQIYDDATNDIERLREKLRMDHEVPIDFFVG